MKISKRANSVLEKLLKNYLEIINKGDLYDKEQAVLSNELVIKESRSIIKN